MAKPELINEKMLLAVTVLCEPGVLQNSIWKTAADIIALILEVRPEFINEDLIKMLSGCFLFQGIGFEIGLSFAQALRVAVEKRPEYAEYAIRELLAVLGDEGIYDYSASAVIKALGLIVPYLPEEKRRHYLARILPFCRVSKIEFFNGGNAQSNYPNFVEGLLANSQTAQLQNPPAEVPRFRRVGDIRSLPRADKTLAEMLKDCQLVRDLAQAPNGALGRTLVYWNGKEKKYLAIKVLKDREDAGNLLLESEMMDYLNDNYDALGLVGQYPQPVMIDGQRAVRTKSLPAEAVSALTEVRTKEGEAIVLDSRYGCYTLMAYEYENRDYFTYLNNASLGAEEFFDAIFLGLHDLFCLARVGIIHTALIDVFHTPQTSGRVDRGRYLWMADIIRRFRGQSGAGRLHNWKKAVAFPNLRVSGLGDLAEFMPLLDMVANPYHPRVVHLSEVNGFGDNKDALQNVFLANFLGDYLLALTLITGSYLEEQSLLSWQDPEMLAEFMRELFNKAYEIFKQTEVFPLAGQIDWQLLARQMAYFMAGDYIGDFSPFTDEHERLAILREKGIFRPDADLRFGEYRRGNWSETEGWPGSLGPINGPLPLQELVRAIYFYTAFMATRIMDNYSTPDRLPLACALKTIGAVIDQSVVGQLENQEPRWQEQARRVVAQLYSKDVGIAYGFTGRIDNVPVKIIQDKNLHPAVDAWSFWAEGDPESKVLVIVTREILAAEIMDEIMFHEYMEWKWIEYYIANCLHTYGNIGRQLTESELWEIRRRAHILTWVKQAQVFQGEEGITPLHKKQLDDLRQ